MSSAGEGQMNESEVKSGLLAQGWSVYKDPGFISHAGPFFYRMDRESPTFCFPTCGKHENRNGVLQGGAFMTFMDRALGATARHLTETPATATVTMTVQFIDAVDIGETVHVTPVMSRATKQLVFMSGVFMVESRSVAVVNGVWKKILKASPGSNSPQERQ
jgi:acyl-coenzyme A thioesterase PaaI-like protein